MKNIGDYFEQNNKIKKIFPLSVSAIIKNKGI